MNNMNKLTKKCFRGFYRKPPELDHINKTDHQQTRRPFTRQWCIFYYKYNLMTKSIIGRFHIDSVVKSSFYLTLYNFSYSN